MAIKVPFLSKSSAIYNYIYTHIQVHMCKGRKCNQWLEQIYYEMDSHLFLQSKWHCTDSNMSLLGGKITPTRNRHLLHRVKYLVDFKHLNVAWQPAITWHTFPLPQSAQACLQGDRRQKFMYGCISKKHVRSTPLVSCIQNLCWNLMQI